jgi:hypothetical protein
MGRKLQINRVYWIKIEDKLIMKIVQIKDNADHSPHKIERSNESDLLGLY